MEKSFPFIKITQREKIFYLTRLPASVVTEVSYASVRGRDEEKGAVQRVLNSRRISNIKEFALNGGNFPNSIVMNWMKDNINIDEKEQKLSFEIEPQSAQLIDGQHRVAGLKEAIAERREFGSYELLT